MGEHTKRGYLLEDFRLFHLKDQGAQVEPHYHEFCKLLLLISGGGSYVIEGQRYLLQPGDAVLVGSGSVHRPELEIGDVYERIILYISPAFLQRESVPDCVLTDCFSPEQGHVLRLTSRRWQRLLGMAQELEGELSAGQPGSALAGKAILLRLLVQLARYQKKPDSLHPEPIRPRNDRIVDILRYLDAHLTEELDIDRLAEQFYISKYHMMRLFHRETGTTIHSYLCQRRLLLARSLIQSGVRATEACYRAGFGSYSTFTRACSRFFGMTPTGKKDDAIALGEDYQ